jgi:hypothetical protein
MEPSHKTEPVTFIKVWEEIDGHNFLVQPEISKYIRQLENDLLETRRLLSNELELKHERIKYPEKN